MPQIRTVKKNQTINNTCRVYTPTETEDNGNATVTHAQRQYSLNKTKALQKKIEKCQSDTIIEMKDNGRQMVISCNTAYYEYLRNNIFQHFERINKNSNTMAVEICNISDANGHIVEHVLRASNRLKHTGNPGQRTKFVINMYNTNNRILANGSSINILIKEHLPIILSMTEERGHDTIAEENRILAQALSRLRDATSTVTENPKPGPAIDVTMTETSNTTTPKLQNEPARTIVICECSEKDRRLLCPLCKTHACMDTIQCDRCNNWYHYMCAKLTKEDVHKFEKTLPSPSSAFCAHL